MGPTVASYAGRDADSFMAAPKKPVRNAPGSTISTLTPSGATSWASASESPSRAHLVAEYAPNPATDNCPPKLLICTMAPDFCLRMCGSTARTSAAGPKKWTSIRSRSSRSVVSSTAPT